jgi:predicted MFS family arabinose efflux permease
VAHIYAVAVLEGALHVFFNIAETAALPRVVAAGQLPQATAQNQAGFAAATIVGPALGTWLYQAAGAACPSWSTPSATCWAPGGVALRTPSRRRRPAPPNLRAEVAEGLRWLWNQRWCATWRSSPAC